MTEGSNGTGKGQKLQDENDLSRRGFFKTGAVAGVAAGVGIAGLSQPAQAQELETRTKAEQIIARFTSDPELTQKIISHADGVRAGTKTIDQIIDEHTSDPDIKRKVYEVIARVQAGYSANRVVNYQAPDANVAEDAAEAGNQHKGAIRQIYDAARAMGG